MLGACGSDSPTAPVPVTTQPDVHAAPAGVRWQTFQGVPVPYAPEAGPNDPTMAIATGYTHTPQGAALAAIGSTIRMSVGTNSQVDAISNQLIAPGPARDQWVVARSLVSITDPVAAADTPLVLGYRIGEYGPQRAAVTVYQRFPDQSMAATAVRVVWRSGDWKLELPPPDSAQSPQTDIDHVPADMVALPPPH